MRSLVHRLPEPAALHEFAALAIPSVLELVLESTLGIQDILFVAPLGVTALASVGVVEWTLATLLTVAQGVSFTLVALVSRHLGAGRRRLAGNVLVCALLITIALSAALLSVGLFASDRLLRSMGASPAVLVEGRQYAQWMISSGGTFAFALVLAGAVRASGHPGYAVRALLIANASNLIAAPLLIFGAGPFAGLGLSGAALATSGARLLAAAILFYPLCSGSLRLRPALVRWCHFRILFASFLRMAAGHSITALLTVGNLVILFRMIAGFGTAALAAGTVTSRAFFLLLMPVWGMGNAIAVLIGRRVGAGNRAGAESIARQISVLAGLAFAVLGLLAMPAIRPLAELSSLGWEVVGLVVPQLRLVLGGLGVATFSHLLWMTYIGAGEVKFPLIGVLANTWTIRLGLAFILSRWWGVQGLFLAIVASECSAAALVGVVFFRRGLSRSAALAHRTARERQ